MNNIEYAAYDRPCNNAKEMAVLCAKDIRDAEGYEAYPYFCSEGALTIGCGTMICKDGVENGTGRFEMAGFTETQKQYAMEISGIVKKGLLSCVQTEDGDRWVRVFKDKNGRRHIIESDDKGGGKHYVLNGNKLEKFDGEYEIDGSSYTMEVERIQGAGVRVKSVKNDQIDGMRTTVLMPELTSGQANALYRDTFYDYYNHMRQLVGADVFDKYPLSVQSLLIRQSYNMGSGNVEALWKDNDLRTLDGAIEACEEAANSPKRTDFDRAMVNRVKQCYHSSCATGESPRKDREAQLVCEEITRSTFDRINDTYLPEVHITASKVTGAPFTGAPDKLVGHRDNSSNDESFWDIDEIDALSRASTKEYLRKESMKGILARDMKNDAEYYRVRLPTLPYPLSDILNVESYFNKIVDKKLNKREEPVNEGTENDKNKVNVGYMLNQQRGR